jgi:hypothetical protein
MSDDSEDRLTQKDLEGAADFYEHGFSIKSIDSSEGRERSYSLFLSNPSKLKNFNFLRNRRDVSSLAFGSVAPIPPRLFGALGRLSSLNELNFWNCRDLNNEVLSLALENIDIKRLNIGNCINITDESLQKLSSSHRLHDLNMAGCEQITDKGISYIGRLQELTSINLTFCSVSDLSISALKKFRRLEKVSLNYCVEISNAGIIDLSTIDSLKYVSLNSCKNMDVYSLQVLQKIPRLEALNVGGTQLSDHDLAELPKQLRSLGLGWMEHVTDEGIPHIVRLSELENLVLNRCKKLTINGIKLLSKLNRLKHLDLRNCLV